MFDADHFPRRKSIEIVKERRDSKNSSFFFLVFLFSFIRDREVSEFGRATRVPVPCVEKVEDVY